MSLTRDVGAPPVLPESVVSILEDFRGCMALNIRAWRLVDGERVPVYSSDDPGPPSPRERRFMVDTAGGPPLEVEVEGQEPESPVVQLLAAVLSRAFDMSGKVASCNTALSERHEEIDLLYRISETLGSILHLEEAARLILEEVSRVLGAKRGSLWVYQPEGQRLQLAAESGGGQFRESIPLDDMSSVTVRAFRRGSPLLAAGSEVTGADQDGRPTGKEDTWLSVPVRYAPQSGEHRTVGVVNLIGRRRRGSFTAADQRLLTAIANQIGAALENNRLIRESMARERVSREMELAHDLQMKLVPPVRPIAGVDAVARVLPSVSVGGDFYQVLQLSGGRLGVMIGDVSGHGFPAALIMALVMSAAAISAKRETSPSAVLEAVDQAIGAELESTEMYLSLCYCVLAPHDTEIRYSNAGHPHAFVVGPDGESRRLFATDPPMGIDGPPYAESSVLWTPGQDLLLLFTDGLSDTVAERHRRSGEELVLQTVAKHHPEPVAEILNRLFEVAERAIPSMPADDRTAVLLRTT